MAQLHWLLAVGVVACAGGAATERRQRRDLEQTEAKEKGRAAMLKEQIEARGIRDPLTLAAMRAVPRHEFVPPRLSEQAYADHPLPIGHGQTISQPYIVAFMTEALQLEAGQKVLEIGTGSGYQAAVLAECGVDVYTIEIVEALALEASERLARLGYSRVTVRAGDGYAGWPEQAPFDAVIITAAAPRIPEPLKLQLRDGGRMILPVGEDFQELIVVIRRGDAFEQQSVLPVRFVPMTGDVRE